MKIVITLTKKEVERLNQMFLARALDDRPKRRPESETKAFFQSLRDIVRKGGK